MRSPKRPRRLRIRSGFLVAGEAAFRSDEPFRHNFTMKFPPYQQRALHLLAELLYEREDFEDEHFPIFRGSYNLAELHAATLDVLSIARSLAKTAARWEEETSKREISASAAADRFAVKLARLAREIEAAIDEIAPRRKADHPTPERNAGQELER
jgi:hypothetical protein